MAFKKTKNRKIPTMTKIQMARFRTCCGALSLLGLLMGCGPSSNPTNINSVPPTTTSVTLSGTSFDFGNNLVGNTVADTVVTVSNTGPIPLTLNPALTSTTGFSIVAAQSCGTSLNPGASCPVVVNYTPTTASAPNSQTAMLNLNFGDVAPGTPSAVSLTGISASMAAGVVTQTGNPLVALYTITPPFAGNVTISFGPSTSYGQQTWSQPTPSGGGPVSIEVAGMRASSTYHMQATVAFSNGITTNDTDHTFATGVANIGNPAKPFTPNLTVTTSAGTTPQPGIELINSLPSALPAHGLYATDLSGNVIWNYQFTDYTGNEFIQEVRQLPNGHFLINIGANSEVPLTGTIPGNCDRSARNRSCRQYDSANHAV